MKNQYVKGFVLKCEQSGVAPEALLKLAGRGDTLARAQRFTQLAKGPFSSKATKTSPIAAASKGSEFKPGSLTKVKPPSNGIELSRVTQNRDLQSNIAKELNRLRNTPEWQSYIGQSGAVNRGRFSEGSKAMLGPEVSDIRKHTAKDLKPGNKALGL